MKLRLLTLNVWTVPWPVSRDTTARLQAIMEKLPDYDADVVAFQEVWTRESANTLLKGAPRVGYSHTWHNETLVGGGGLLVLSRLPIREAVFTPFTLNGLPQRLHHGDFYSGKGFVRLTLEMRGGTLSFVNTHLHARYSGSEANDDYVGHRAAQVIELAAGLVEVSDPVVALGDFNLRENSPGYRALLGLSRMRDVALDLDNRQNTILWENPYRQRGAQPGIRVDYAFVRDGHTDAARPLSVQRVFDDYFEIGDHIGSYSDHAGLLTEVEIGGPPGPALGPSPLALDLAEALLNVGREKAQIRRREERLWAVTGGAGSIATLMMAQRVSVSRRRLLRALFFGVPAAGLLSCAGITTLTEGFVPEELRSYDTVEKVVRRMRRLQLKGAS